MVPNYAVQFVDEIRNRHSLGLFMVGFGFYIISHTKCVFFDTSVTFSQPRCTEESFERASVKLTQGTG